MGDRAWHQTTAGRLGEEDLGNPSLPLLLTGLALLGGGDDDSISSMR